MSTESSFSTSFSANQPGFASYSYPMRAHTQHTCETFPSVVMTSFFSKPISMVLCPGFRSRFCAKLAVVNPPRLTPDERAINKPFPPPPASRLESSPVQSSRAPSPGRNVMMERNVTFVPAKTFTTLREMARQAPPSPEVTTEYNPIFNWTHDVTPSFRVRPVYSPDRRPSVQGAIYLPAGLAFASGRHVVLDVYLLSPETSWEYSMIKGGKGCNSSQVGRCRTNPPFRLKNYQPKRLFFFDQAILINSLRNTY